MPRQTCFVLQIVAYCVLIDLSFAINGMNVRTASPNEFRYVVSLSQRDPNEPRGDTSNIDMRSFEDQHLCTGTLISRTNVLTLAHCVLKVHVSLMVIIAGSNNWSNGRKYYPESWITYDQWKHGRVHENPLHNVAVIRLQGEGINDSKVSPVPISFAPTKTLYHKKIRLAGWGVSERKNIVRFMRTAGLTVIPNEQCIEKGSELLNRTFNLPANYFCSIAVPWALSSPGDAGAPLLNKSRELIGLNIGTCPNVEGFRYTTDFINVNQMNCHVRLSLYQEFIEQVNN